MLIIQLAFLFLYCKGDPGDQWDSSDESQGANRVPSLPSDNVSMASDVLEGSSPDFPEEIPLVAAQDLSNILKQGYLEKKRRDHSFFTSEWQKRWCIISNNIFYYYGTEKDKQQKGAFYISDYTVQFVCFLRKDKKSNACFELSAPDKRSYQFTAANQDDANEWVDQIEFLLKDLCSTSIPFEEDEETYDDIENTPKSIPRPVPSQAVKAENLESEEDEDEDGIYEELPDDDLLPAEVAANADSDKTGEVDYANFYQGLWDCIGDHPDELSFQRGDLIHILSKEYNMYGWWVGDLKGSIGIVPKDFLMPAYEI
ncbi:src kinase-associated phosphoprotein 1 [Latimeria chalumnae]|uniref:src kinase-associated phosphoprotein 1 n=1 Tax=Latimeria chalumnae TaxID=7897 RepID=UPI00313C0F53